jgi:hypothetical protein
MAASWRALQIRSNIESRANRISNSVIWSQVNHDTPKKPTYAQRAIDKIRTYSEDWMDYYLFTFQAVDFMSGSEG